MKGIDMKKILFCLIGIASIHSTTVFAKDDVYIEVGATAFTYQETYSSATYTWGTGTAGRFILGADIADHFALEAIYATGISSGNLTISGYSTSVALNSMYGLYVKPKIELNDNFTLFARLGYANSTGTATIPALSYTSQTSTGSTPSYGFGAGYKINDKASVNLDYMVYSNQSSYNITGTTIGFGYKF
jgi:opacity protein-like surface antigen